MVCHNRPGKTSRLVEKEERGGICGINISEKKGRIREEGGLDNQGHQARTGQIASSLGRQHATFYDFFV